MTQDPTLSPPKSPYQTFIEENDKILNDLNRRSKNRSLDLIDDNPSSKTANQNENEEDYYESIKETLEMSNINVDKLQDSNSSIISKGRNAPFTPVKEIKKDYTESAILPPQHNLIVSPLDIQKQQKDNDSVNTNKKVEQNSLQFDDTNKNLKVESDQMESENNQDEPAEEETQNENPKKSELLDATKELFKSDNQSPKKNDISSQIKLKSPNRSNKTKSTYSKSKSRSSVSQSPNKTWSIENSQLATSYVDYLDIKRKQIYKKWEQEDNRKQKEIEDSKFEAMLIPKSNFRQFKSPPKEKTQSNFDDGEEMDKNDQPFQVVPPPNPSEHYKKMAEIPVIERLLTPKKNVDIQQKQQSQSPSKRAPYSAKAKKTIPVNEDEFITRQAQYDNSRRLKLEMLAENSQIKPSKKRADDKVFNDLYEKSLHPKEIEPSPKKKGIKISDLEAKWSQDSHLIMPKKIPKPPEPINPKDYRDQCFSKESQIIAQKDKRSFQERNETTFDDVLNKYQKDKEEAKKREQYKKHLETLELND